MLDIVQDGRTHLNDRLGNSKDGLDGSMALLKVALYPSASVMVKKLQHCVGSATIMMLQSAIIVVQQCHRNSAAVMDTDTY